MLFGGYLDAGSFIHCHKSHALPRLNRRLQKNIRPCIRSSNLSPLMVIKISFDVTKSAPSHPYTIPSRPGTYSPSTFEDDRYTGSERQVFRDLTPYLHFDLPRHLGVVVKQLLYGIPTLSELIGVIAEPAPAFLNDP